MGANTVSSGVVEGSRSPCLVFDDMGSAEVPFLLPACWGPGEECTSSDPAAG